MSVALINPATGARLKRDGEVLRDAGGARFPVIAGVPRICPSENYAVSFGLQWTMFARTQIDDSVRGQRASERRFFAATGWTADELRGQDVLEAGSGAGRFSRVVLEQTEANLWSFDYSTAVDANWKNNGHIAPGRFQLFQASIYEMPFPDGSFDRVFCFGVLQHTPDFEASVSALIAKAKPGGQIVVDFYPIRHALTKVHAKYVLRPFTRRMAHDQLLRLIDRNAGWLLAVSDLLDRVRLSPLKRFLPLADPRLFPEGLTSAERREWAVLDTFDWFSPEHDHPQRISAVTRMFERHGASVNFAGYVDTGTGIAAVVRGTKR